MEFELPKINVSCEYDKEKDEMVFVINGVEKRVKTEDMITEMEKLHEQNTALEQEPCEDCISRAEAQKHIYQRLWESALNNVGYECKAEDVFMDIADNRLSTWISEIPIIQPKPKTGQFEKWVATEIFDDNWEYNKDAFAEIACRKLEKLGIVRAKGDMWELVEPQESEDKE